MLCLCTVQEGQVPHAVRDELAAELSGVVARSFDEHDGGLQLLWVEVGAGNGFSAREPSRCSIVGLLVPDGTPPTTREPLMQAVCDAWTRVTGCSADDVVVSVVDEGSLTPTAST
jgi:hypothetical protein